MSRISYSRWQGIATLPIGTPRKGDSGSDEVVKSDMMATKRIKVKFDKRRPCQRRESGCGILMCDGESSDERDL